MKHQYNKIKTSFLQYQGEETILYSGPPKRIKGLVLEYLEAKRNYKTLREFPLKTMFVSKKSLNKVNRSN